jgi:ferredoxin-NADP reductase
VETLTGAMSRDRASRTFVSKVLGHHRLSETGYELTLERHALSFDPGMLVTMHGPDVTEDREYTISSGVNDDVISILYRWIPTGRLTTRLIRLEPGDPVRWTGPHGGFTLRNTSRRIVFVATGTGIAPCRSFFRSHPDLNLTICHGVRTAEDLFYRSEFSSADYFPCVSGAAAADLYAGRVTDRIEGIQTDLQAHYYLCGAYEMIFDVSAILKKAGVPESQIFTEPYYYKS